MKNRFIGAIAALNAATCIAAAPAATILFAQEGTQIVDANGVARTAKKGDAVQSGERLLTTTGAISQLQLPDGSLIGVRPGSEMRLAVEATAPQSAPVITLIQGTARVIGSELMDARKISNITLQSGNATLRLQGADLESAVVRADKGPRPETGATPSAAGSYQRLLVGNGSIGTGAQSTSLAPRQVHFVGANNTAPTVIASAMPAAPVFNRVAANTERSEKNTLAAPTAPPSRTGSITESPASFADRSPTGLVTPAMRTPGRLPPEPTAAVQSPPVFTPIVKAPTISPIAATPPVTLAPPTPSAPLAPAPTVVMAPLPVAPAPLPIAPLPTAAIPTTPILVAITTPTAPILTPVTIPTTPITMSPPPVTLAPVVQPVATLPSPINTQPIVTKPPVCIRLIAGKCV